MGGGDLENGGILENKHADKAQFEARRKILIQESTGKNQPHTSLFNLPPSRRIRESLT